MADKIYIKHNLGNFNQPYIARSTVNAQNPIIAQQNRRQPRILQVPSTYQNRQPSTYRDPVSAQEPNIRNKQHPFNRSYRTPNAVSNQVPFTYPTIAQQPATYQHQSPSIYTAQAQIPSQYQHQSPYITRRSYTFQSPAIYQHQSPYTFRSPGTVQQPGTYQHQQPATYDHRSPYTIPKTYSHRTPVSRQNSIANPVIRNRDYQNPVNYQNPVIRNKQSPVIAQSPTPVIIANGTVGTTYYFAGGRNRINSPFAATRVPSIVTGGQAPMAPMSWNAYGIHNHQSSSATNYDSQVELSFRLDCNWLNGSPYFNLWVKRGPTGNQTAYSGSYFCYDEIDTSTVMGSTAGWYIASNWDLPSSIVNSGSGFKINMILQDWTGSNGTVSGIQPVTSFDYSHTNISYGTDISSLVGTSDPNSIWTGTGTGASAFHTKTVNGSASSTFNNAVTASTQTYPADPGGSGAQTASSLSWGMKTTALRMTGGNTATFTQSSNMDIIVQIELEDQHTSSSNDLPYHLVRTSNLLQRVTTGGGGGGGGGAPFTPFSPTFQSFYQEPLQQEINRFNQPLDQVENPIGQIAT